MPQAPGNPLSLDDYLTAHFVPKPAFAEMAGISLGRLEELLALNAVPRASYTSDGQSIQSRVFGNISGQASIPGEYFRPECVRWAQIANRAPQGEERAAVLAALVQELSAGLEAFGLSTQEIQQKTAAYLPAFFDGTFGLCVADPSNGQTIVRKEILQERLANATENGANPRPATLSQTQLLQLIDDYAGAAMPFSPAEYARSSRKRLVDDLRPAVAAT